MMNSRRQSSKKNGHPSGDERLKAVDLAMRRFKYEKDALLEVLNTTQETFGYLDKDVLIYISTNLQVPLSQIYGVASFYHMFSFEPLGENNCIVCTGTACHVKGADKIVRALSDEFSVEPGGTTADDIFSLTTARCVGSCGLAPVLLLNGTVKGRGTPENAVRQVREVIEESKTLAEAQ